MSSGLLTAGNFLVHRTVCELRQVHLKAFLMLFVKVVQLAREAELLKLGRVAINSTWIRANASERKAMAYGRMHEVRSLKIGIAELFKQAEAEDREGDRRYGEDECGRIA